LAWTKATRAPAGDSAAGSENLSDLPLLRRRVVLPLHNRRIVPFRSVVPFAVVAIAAAATFPAHAATDEEDPSLTPPGPPSAPPPRKLSEPPRQHSAIYAVLGLGTPVGFAGFEGVHRFGPWFELSAGVGRGMSALASGATHGRDVQWSVMPRIRLGQSRTALTIGAGISAGNFGGGGEWFCDGPCPRRDVPLDYTFWGNLEAGIEHWFIGGVALRTFLGYARACSESTCGTGPAGNTTFPYLGFGLGYAF
jgi:hypothetical protein